MPIEIESINCKGHGSCADVCPASVFKSADGKCQVVSPEDCTDCGACIEACPENAIVKKKKGLLIVGEKINGSIKEVEQAIANRDEGLIQALAIRQEKAGSGYIDVNAGTTGDKELEDITWLIETIQPVVSTPLCIDTTNVNVLKKVLPLLKSAPLINSVNGDDNRLESTLPLIKEYGCHFIALTVGPKNLPEPLPERLKYAEKIMNYVRKYEIPFNRVYFDPLVMPLSIDNKTIRDFYEIIKILKNTYPQSKAICGLSNLSYGLPKRKFLNQIFVVGSIANGLDAAILDPLDKKLMLMIIGSEAFMGLDSFCARYKNVFSKIS